MKGDTEGGAAWGRASGRGSPQRGGGAGGAMGVRHAGDILRRCPQKGLRPGGGAGVGGRCRKRKTGRKGEGEREWRKKRVGEEERERRKEEGRKPANRKRR